MVCDYDLRALLLDVFDFRRVGDAAVDGYEELRAVLLENEVD